jgi:biotin carboxyl carrier protein
MTTYTVTVQGTSYAVEVKERRGTTLTFLIEGETYSVSVETNFSQPLRVARPSSNAQVSPAAPRPSGAEIRSTPNEVRAPIPGIVSDIKVTAGQSVESGATLVVIEAMKMENPIRAHRSGVIKDVSVRKGDEITSGTLLVTYEDPSVAQ